MPVKPVSKTARLELVPCPACGLAVKKTELISHLKGCDSARGGKL